MRRRHVPSRARLSRRAAGRGPPGLDQGLQLGAACLVPAPARRRQHGGAELACDQFAVARLKRRYAPFPLRRSSGRTAHSTATTARRVSARPPWQPARAAGALTGPCDALRSQGRHPLLGARQPAGGRGAGLAHDVQGARPPGRAAPACPFSPSVVAPWSCSARWLTSRSAAPRAASPSTRAATLPASWRCARTRASHGVCDSRNADISFFFVSLAGVVACRRSASPAATPWS